MDGLRIWAIAVDPPTPTPSLPAPARPTFSAPGTAGQNWEKLAADITQECAIGPPRVTALLVDPVDRDTVLAGVEIDGVYRSRDGGDTWSQVRQGITNPDIHGMAYSVGEQKNRPGKYAPGNLCQPGRRGDLPVPGDHQRLPLPLLPLGRSQARQPAGAVRRHRGRGHRQTPEPFNAPPTAASPGSPAPCRWNPTRRCGTSPPTRPTPT